MITVLIATVEAHTTLASLTIAAAMFDAFCALTAAVVRTSSDRSRHARFWSPPRPARILAIGRHTETYRRRAYAATRAKHTARPRPQIQAVLESATPAVISPPDTEPWRAVSWELTTQPIRQPEIRQFARTA